MQIIKQRGIGLIETLLVTLLIALGVVGLVKLQNQLAYNANYTTQQSTATFLAESKMESLRDFNVITTTSGAEAYNDITSGTSTSTVGPTTYTLTWTVTTNTTIGYKNIAVTVTWTDNYNVARTLTLNSNIASIDPGTQKTPSS